MFEITEKEKSELAAACGYSEDRYTDMVKEGVKKSEYDKDRENAIMRKLGKTLVDHIIFGKPITRDDVAEFLKYYDDIESIKAEAKATSL